ncbi:MAG: DUF2330 domain-containing protein [Myxococcales bacterium]|nr:DUF2330 domain-containing protein [Myxococcales bacterium]
MNRSPFLRAATALGLGALALGTVATTSTPASACGGFFCSQVPIDQMGEDIIFGYGANGTVTAQILINYTGEAKDFAWILPVPSKPEISIGSNAAFQVIRGMTQPSWYLQWNYDNAGQCGGWFYYPEAAAGGVDDDGSNQGGVTVVESKDVGPFATVILESSSTEELVQWLNDNGYDQPAESTPLIDHYVQQGMMFVALKLKQNESSGSIQPIVLEMQEDDPCVPLVLTQIAATPDMPVRTYILGDHRVVPTNWMHVVLNEKKIDWLNYGQNYQDLVTQAVNEAAGHGFVTEYAGSSALLDGALYRDGQFDLARLAQITSPAAFVDELLRQGFPRDTTMQGLLRKYIPMPAEVAAQGVDERSFYNNLEGYDLSGIEFDPQGFVADLEERVITPLREAQDLFDASPYLTRLFTTVSPEEMDRDPVFVQNADLGDVSNQHTAMAQSVCDEDDPQKMKQIIITLESGETLTVDGPFDDYCPYCGGETIDLAPTEPAAARIELIGRTGQPVLVDPGMVAEVDKALGTKNPETVLNEVVTGVITPPPTTTPTTRKGGSYGCSGGGEAAPLAVALGFLGLAVLRRRREAETRA